CIAAMPSNEAAEWLRVALRLRPGIAEAEAGREWIAWVKHILVERGDPGASGERWENCGLAIHGRGATHAADELGADQAFVHEGLAFSDLAAGMQHGEPRTGSG